MKTPRALTFMVLLVVTGATGCNRAQTERDAERAAEQVKVAAEQAGDRLADGWLTTKIQAQFFADDDIKSRFINVSSRDGVVRLKGFVESDDARRQVLEITRNTDGVRQIDDRQLLVGRPAHEFEPALPDDQAPVPTTGVDSAVTTPAPTDDGSVVSVIQARYFLDPTLKLRHIDVQSMNGVVILKGQIASETERAQALSLARSAPGVVRVEDYLAVDAAIQ
jgi:hyperosmotically inducible protein